MKRFFCFLLAVTFTATSTWTGNAQTPAPSRTTEAWCMMFQVMDQIRRHTANRDLSGIHNEDTILNVAVSTLLREIQAVSTEKREQAQLALTTFGRRVGELHVAADAGDAAKVHVLLPPVLEAFNEVQTFYDSNVLTPAQEMAARYTCSMHADVIGKKGGSCPKCGMELDQLLRPALFQPGAVQTPVQTIKAQASVDAILQPNKPVNGILHLSRIFDDSPVTWEELYEVHTQKIHLFIVDQSLTDYHHEHTIPSDVKGQYTFSFTPKKPGSYRLWADVRPIATGFQEYARTDLPADGTPEPLTDKKEIFTSKQDGLHFELSLSSSPIIAGQPVSGKLRVTDARGKPVTRLEPVMGTFAHLVGFYEDYKNVLHIHPKSGPVLQPDSRGGPELEFTFYAPLPGFIRLFSQVQIEGEQKFAPFGIQVRPPM